MILFFRLTETPGQTRRSSHAAATPSLCLLLLLSHASLAAAPPCQKPLDVCVAEKRALFAQRGVLGFAFSVPTADGRQTLGLPKEAAFVVCLAPRGYPAEAAGLRTDDGLVAMNGVPLAGTSQEELLAKLASVHVGETVDCKIWRGGHLATVSIVAGKPDSRSIEAWVAQHVHDSHSPEEYQSYLHRQRADAAPARSDRPGGEASHQRR
ncbi:MAG: PDZ domain-containing protein [Acidobacteriota bacterium]|nr:PDZ domain-containing protein [Acidobacteriota bacterium]